MSYEQARRRNRRPVAAEKRTRRKKEIAVPAWFNKRVEAGTVYHILEERSYITPDGKRQSDIKAIIENVTPGEFIEIARGLGLTRGYASA